MQPLLAKVMCSFLRVRVGRGNQLMERVTELNRQSTNHCATSMTSHPSQGSFLPEEHRQGPEYLPSPLHEMQT